MSILNSMDAVGPFPIGDPPDGEEELHREQKPLLLAGVPWDSTSPMGSFLRGAPPLGVFPVGLEPEEDEDPNP